MIIWRVPLSYLMPCKLCKWKCSNTRGFNSNTPSPWDFAQHITEFRSLHLLCGWRECKHQSDVAAAVAMNGVVHSLQHVTRWIRIILGRSRWLFYTAENIYDNVITRLYVVNVTVPWMNAVRAYTQSRLGSRLAYPHESAYWVSCTQTGQTHRHKVRKLSLQINNTRRIWLSLCVDLSCAARANDWLSSVTVYTRLIDIRSLPIKNTLDRKTNAIGLFNHCGFRRALTHTAYYYLKSRWR